MNRLIILAALLLSVVGGLTLMSSSSPLAAQTSDPSATRSLQPATVEPDGTVTVTIAFENVASPGRVTETLPSGFTYVDGSLTSSGTATMSAGGSDLAQGVLAFNLLGASSLSYQVTAGSTEGPFNFSGTLNSAGDDTDYTVGGAATVTVSTATGPDPEANDLQFDIVPSKAVKGAQVSGVGNPIDSDALVWAFDTDVTLADGAGDLGDFEVKGTGNDNEFGLYVVNSGAAPTGGSQRINVTVTSTNADGVEVNSTLRGVITSQAALDITSANAFTIPQGIGDGTLIGNFTVTGGIEGEYLDGILTGTGNEKFSVNDSDMTLTYKGGGLDVGTYSLQLTVSGDAGLANRTAIEPVTITVTASNMAPTVPATFMATIDENDPATGTLVEAGTAVGDSISVSANDGDELTYGLAGADAGMFAIAVENDVISVSVGDADIADSTPGPFNFQITVSDGITANEQTISATVMVNQNSPVAPAGDAVDGTLDLGVITVTAADNMPQELADLQALVSDADENTVTFEIDDNPPHIVHSDDDKLLLTYLPTAPGDTTPSTITVTASDGWNDDPDATITVTVSVTVDPRPAITSNFVGISVTENTKVCMQDGSEGCSLAGIVDGATSYSIESGVDYQDGSGNNNYAVDNAGTITVVNEPNFEDALNPAFLVNANDAAGDLAGLISVRVTIVDMNEAPVFAAGQSATAFVSEDAQKGQYVLASDAEGAGNFMLVASDPDPADSVTFEIEGKASGPFVIEGNQIKVNENNALDYDAKDGKSHTLTIVATDGVNRTSLSVVISVGNENESPWFTSPTGAGLTIAVNEGARALGPIQTFEATDTEDPDALVFSLKNQDDTNHFSIDPLTGVLTLTAALDYETATEHLVEVNVTDPNEASAEVQLRITVNNLNDEDPTWNATPKTELNLSENTSRGTMLANYSATDPDNLDTGITYSLTGTNYKSFEIADNGDLMTLESIDADSGTPCAGGVCNITVNASDGAQTLTASVRITVVDAEDSVSTLDIRKANPVPGPNAGLPDSALSGAKTTRNAAVPERPADLPATITSYDLDNDGTPDNITDAVNFVETEWANWGTVLLIEITSESPDSDCGNGNQCVVVELESDSADDKLKVIAYRSAHQENKFLAAVKLVGRSASSGDGERDPGYLMPTDHKPAGGIRPRDLGATPGDDPVYNHRNADGSVYRDSYGNTHVPRIQVDEEDEINIAFDNLRDSVDVENDPPEIESFAPEHESAFDDADVDYSFRVTDALSGIPSPEDLPDGDGDEDYIPVIAVVSGTQCARPEISIGEGRTVRADVAQCNDRRGIHEYDATTASRDEWGYIAVREDKDFDDIENGYDVETTLVLDEDKYFFVTFVAVDRAGNMTYFDPDGSDDDVEYAEIVIDTNEPELYEARTGVTWDEGDEKYDDDRSVIQVIFDDLTKLNPETVEIDDFVVQGHTVVAVNVYEQPDEWTDDSRYAMGGETKYKSSPTTHLRQSIETSVFLHLEDELQADETPDVTLVPNGVEDVAGNEQDDGEAEADDWISPAFTIVSIVSPRVTTENPDKVLAGDGDEVVFNVTVDERLSTARPTVTVSYVDASMVDTKGTASCDNDDGADKGKRKRGEIVMNTSGETSDDCADNGLATDHNLKTTIEKVTNTEWIITVGEPKGTGYYNFHIAGKDRSAQQNPGSEGVAPDSIVTDFYDSDGDVNVGDAVYYEGDINLPKPNVRLGGVRITDNEPSVEYRSRLFLEIDFTQRYEDAVACENLPSLSDNYRLANCMNENSEYSEDNFDDIVITSFVLDGVDITDQVDASTTDRNTFLATLENIGLGDHEVEIQAMDQAGNELEDTLEIDFEVSDRDPFEKRLSPGWNLVSLPGEPADSSIGSVFGPGVEVRTVYTYDPVIPGGWMVAVRESLDSDWQGDLTEITGSRGYWVLSDAIQDWEVSIPRLAGGAAGTGTPIQPPVIPLYAGWNLIPVTDISGNGSGGDTVSATVYLQSLEAGVEAARVLGFDTIRNQWETVLDPDMQMNNTLEIGSAYWIFVREATSLVPSGYVGGGGGD